jgi:hypothetical protein
MKKLLLSLVFVVLFAFSVFAASVEVTWNANTESDLAGYKVYTSTSAAAFAGGTATLVATVNAPTVSYIHANVVDGTFFYALTAFDASGNESVFSDIASIKVDTTAPGKPANLRLKVNK